MYLFFNTRQLLTDNLYAISNYIITKKSSYIMIISVLDFIFNCNTKSTFIVNLNSYKLNMLSNIALLIFMATFILSLYRNSSIYIEVYTFNLNALSLYLWIGFHIVTRRNNYYLLSNTDVLFDNCSAYSLNNSKFFSKNMIRRYLIILNK